jgi:hypothetical protein
MSFSFEFYRQEIQIQKKFYRFLTPLSTIFQWQSISFLEETRVSGENHGILYTPNLK